MNKEEDKTLTHDKLTLDNINIMVDDNEIDLEDIYGYIVSIIKNAEKIKNYKGEAKKYYTITKLKEILPIHVFSRFEPLLDKAIDFIVFLSKNPEILKEVNKVVKCCNKRCKETCKDTCKIFSCCK